LMYAAAANPSTEVVKLLLQAGSDPDRKSQEGYSAREYVQMNPNKESMLALFK